MKAVWLHTTFYREIVSIGFLKEDFHVRLTKFFFLAKISCHNPANNNTNMADKVMTIGDVLDQIVKDSELADRREARHKRRGTIPKFRKRLFLARIKAQTK